MIDETLLTLGLLVRAAMEPEVASIYIGSSFVSFARW